MENLVGIFAISAFGIVTAQFQNPFSAMMNTGTGSTNNATGCGTRINSCAPWCSKSLDANGCMVCSCQNGGMRPMGGINPMSGGINPMSGGMNPMSGGMNPMGMNPMNQMSQMFPGLTGGSSPMTGNVQKQGQTACSPAPTTCPVPQPWCERIADVMDEKVVAYVQGLNGQKHNPSSGKHCPQARQLRIAPSKSTVNSYHGALKPNQIEFKSCLETFYCTI
ncbi:uncharacterized protein LOC132741764 [Ruditapes philippinarum]|uniref:uncharacterized protein LOC132741764 n=1 Tax=Ruditapes philippinarum TaxID=129788 RepID=UPI00295C3361|nr:uncharacterized protein LOC132741764 [Ruditapes philippinarum]